MRQSIEYTAFTIEGFCWTNILNPQARLLKVKMKKKSVNDVGSMSLISIVTSLPNYYFVILLNSELLFNYYREYINCTVNIQINDIRQLPIIVPTKEQLDKCKLLYETAINLKKKVFNDHCKESEIAPYLLKIEKELNEIVAEIYRF
jgi:hypothetical protein